MTLTTLPKITLPFDELPWDLHDSNLLRVPVDSFVLNINKSGMGLPGDKCAPVYGAYITYGGYLICKKWQDYATGDEAKAAAVEMLNGLELRRTNRIIKIIQESTHYEQLPKSYKIPKTSRAKPKPVSRPAPVSITPVRPASVPVADIRSSLDKELAAVGIKR